MFRRSALTVGFCVVLAASALGHGASGAQAAHLYSFCNQYGTYTDYIYYSVPNPFAPSEVDQVTVTYGYNSSYSCGASRFFAALSTSLASTSTQWGSLRWSRSGIHDGIGADTIPPRTVCSDGTHQSNSYGLPASGNFSGVRFLPAPPAVTAELNTTFTVSDPCTSGTYMNYYYNNEIQPT